MLGDVQHLHKVHSRRDVQGDILGWNTGSVRARQSRILAECRVLTTFVACALIPSTQLLRTHRFQGLGKALLLSPQVPQHPHTSQELSGRVTVPNIQLGTWHFPPAH